MTSLKLGLFLRDLVCSKFFGVSTSEDLGLKILNDMVIFLNEKNISSVGIRLTMYFYCNWLFLIFFKKELLLGIGQ